MLLVLSTMFSTIVLYSCHLSLLIITPLYFVRLCPSSHHRIEIRTSSMLIFLSLAAMGIKIPTECWMWKESYWYPDEADRKWRGGKTLLHFFLIKSPVNIYEFNLMYLNIHERLYVQIKSSTFTVIASILQEWKGFSTKHWLFATYE